jgi:hypothetical protein
MAILAQYTQGRGDVRVTLEAGETLGGIDGPTSFLLPLTDPPSPVQVAFEAARKRGDLTISEWKPPSQPPVDLAAYAKSARDRHEEGGITVSGVPIATDDRSKTLVLGARRRVEKDPSLVTKWSAADGSIYPLDASTIIAVSDAIGDFVAELFEAYAGIMVDLAAGTIKTPEEIDARYGALDVAF